MSDYNPIKDLGLTCPYGGIFYICADDPDRFIGCCTINPCGARKGLCPDHHLRATSFNVTLQHEFLPQACISDNIDVSWYTCVGEGLPFLGCCAVDPCLRGVCPERDLRAAKLSDKAKNAQGFLDGDPEYMSRPMSSTLGSGSSVSSVSLCASSTTAMTTMISSFMTSFVPETTMKPTIPTIASTVTAMTSVMTTLPTEALGAPPTNPKDEGPNRQLGWLAVLFLIPIFLLLFLVYRSWKSRCSHERGDKRPKVEPEQRHEQEHRHEQQEHQQEQQRGHEQNPNTHPYPAFNRIPTGGDFRNIGGRPSMNVPQRTLERPQNIRVQQLNPLIKDGRSVDNKETVPRPAYKSNQQAPYASVRRTAPNRKPLPVVSNHTSWR